MSRHRYPTEFCRVFERTTTEKLQAFFTSSKEPDNPKPLDIDEGGKKASEPKTESLDNLKGGKTSETVKNSSEGNRSKQQTLKIVLGEALGYGPALSEHIILDAGLVPSTKLPKDNKLDAAAIQVLALAVAKFEDWLQDIIFGERIPEGYILLQNKSSGKDRSTSEPGMKVFPRTSPSPLKLIIVIEAILSFFPFRTDF